MNRRMAPWKRQMNQAKRRRRQLWVSFVMVLPGRRTDGRTVDCSQNTCNLSDGGLVSPWKGEQVIGLCDPHRRKKAAVQAAVEVSINISWRISWRSFDGVIVVLEIPQPPWRNVQRCDNAMIEDPSATAADEFHSFERIAILLQQSGNWRGRWSEWAIKNITTWPCCL